MTQLEIAMRVGRILESLNEGNHDTFSLDPYNTVKKLLDTYCTMNADNKESIESIRKGIKTWKDKNWETIVYEADFDLFEANDIVSLLDNLLK